MTTTDTGADTATDATTDTTTNAGTTTDTAAEVAKWKALAQKHEDRAKANAAAARELDALKQSSMTDLDKAVETARAETRTETLREVGGKLAEASIRVAASTRMTPAQLDGLLEGIDAAKFLDTSGDPDTKAINVWVDKVAPVSDAGHRKPNVVPREGTTTSKPGEEPLRTMVRDLFSRGGE